MQKITLLLNKINKISRIITCFKNNNSIYAKKRINNLYTILESLRKEFNVARNENWNNTIDVVGRIQLVDSLNQMIAIGRNSIIKTNNGNFSSVKKN